MFEKIIKIQFSVLKIVISLNYINTFELMFLSVIRNAKE